VVNCSLEITGTPDITGTITIDGVKAEGMISFSALTFYELLVTMISNIDSSAYEAYVNKGEVSWTCSSGQSGVMGSGSLILSLLALSNLTTVVLI
jgi:hypothetical protein